MSPCMDLAIFIADALKDLKNYVRMMYEIAGNTGCSALSCTTYLSFVK